MFSGEIKNKAKQTIPEEIQDGKIDYVELVKTLNVAKHGSEEDKIRFVFNVFDLDKDGKISKEEMNQFLLALMLATGKTGESTRKEGKKSDSEGKCFYNKKFIQYKFNINSFW